MAGFKGLGKFRRKAKKKGNAALHKLTEDAFGTLVRNSPVDLGNFRGNWLGSKNVPRIGDPKNYRRSEGTTGTIQSQRVSNAGVTKGAPPTSFERSNLAPALTAKLGEKVYITNNLDYATALENGHSPQAPNGVLHVSAQEVRARNS